MILDKHQLDDIEQITEKTLSVGDFEKLLIDADYLRLGKAPAKGKRVKIWWRYNTHRRIESIYSPSKTVGLMN